MGMGMKRATGISFRKKFPSARTVPYRTRTSRRAGRRSEAKEAGSIFFFDGDGMGWGTTDGWMDGWVHYLMRGVRRRKQGRKEGYVSSEEWEWEWGFAVDCVDLISISIRFDSIKTMHR